MITYLITFITLFSCSLKTEMVDYIQFHRSIGYTDTEIVKTWGEVDGNEYFRMLYDETVEKLDNE